MSVAIKEEMKISIARDFSSTPGSRNIFEGAYSGEEFLIKILEPKFQSILQSDNTIEIDLDGTEGFATSFLEEAFGGLARKYDPKLVLEKLYFISNDEPLLIEEIKSYIQDARRK